MNEVPHPGFDKPEEYETFLTTNGLEDAANKYTSTLCDRADEGLRIDTTLESAFKAGAEWQKEQILNWARDKEIIDELNKRIAAKDKFAEGYLVAMVDLIKDIKNKLI